MRHVWSFAFYLCFMQGSLNFQNFWTKSIILDLMKFRSLTYGTYSEILFLLTLHFLRNISQNIILYRESNIFHTKRVGPLCCIWNFYFNVVGYYGNITPTSLLLGCVAEKNNNISMMLFSVIQRKRLKFSITFIVHWRIIDYILNIMV